MAFDVRTVLNKPFQYGARGPDAFDCFGVVVEYYRQEGRPVPDIPGYTDDPREPNFDAFDGWRGDAWAEVRGAAKTGDVFTFCYQHGIDAATHCGVLLNDGKILHATKSHGVTVTPLRYLRTKIRRVYRPCLA